MLVQREIARREEQIEALKKQQDDTKAKWKEARRIASETPDERFALEKNAIAESLMKTIKEQQAQIEKLNDEILALELGEMVIEMPPPEEMQAELQKVWLDDAVLHLLDYDEPRGEFEQIFNTIQQQDFAALILVQKSVDYIGKLYWQHIEKIYRNAGGGSPITVGFRPTEPFTAQGFLDKLGTYVQTEELAAQAPEKHPAFIAEQLLQQADFGGTIAIRVDCSTIAEGTMDWFLNVFWQAVREELRSDKFFGVKIVIFFFIEDELNISLPPEIICDPAGFEPAHVCEIQLRNWQPQHVRRWFMQPTVLQPLKQWQLERQVLRNIMERLSDECERVDGLPDRFYGRLLSGFIKRIVDEEIAV